VAKDDYLNKFAMQIITLTNAHLQVVYEILVWLFRSDFYQLQGRAERRVNMLTIPLKK